MTFSIHTGAPSIALYTEGTYPQAHGGVSVWVDQLVRGWAITGSRCRPSPAFRSRTRRSRCQTT